MTAPAFQRILDAARVHLPGALDGAMQVELFNVMKEFTQRTNALTEDIAFNSKASVSEYLISSPVASTTINRLLWVEGGGGVPVAASLKNPGDNPATLVLAQQPSAAEALTAHVGLMIADPTDRSGLPVLPQWFVSKFQLVFLYGLLSHMMAHPAKPYSNIAGAQYYGRRFNDTMGRARAEVIRGYRYGGQAWAFPRAFRTRTQRF